MNFFTRTDEFNRLVKALDHRTRPISVRGVIESAKPFFLACLAEKTARPVVFVRGLAGELGSFESACRFFLKEIGSELRAVSFPALFENPYFEVPPPLESVSARMSFFYDVLHRPPGIVVTNAAALLKPVPKPEEISSYFFRIDVGAETDRDVFISALDLYGYTREDLVAARGEYARRGGIVDVFPPWQAEPFRIEFGVSEVLSIRQFDPSTQRSIRKAQSLVVSSLREFPASEDFLKDWTEAARNRWKGHGNFKDKLSAVASRDFSPAFQAEAVLNSKSFSPALEYLREAIFVIDRREETEKQWSDHVADLEDQCAELAGEKRCVLKPGEIFLLDEWSTIKDSAVGFDEIDSSSPNEGFSFGFQSVPRFDNKIPFFLQYLQKLQTEANFCFIYLANAATRKRLALLLRQNGIACLEIDTPARLPGGFEISLLLGPLDRGFSYPREKINLFSEKEIFTEERVIVRRLPKRPVVTGFHDIKAGDFVVHSEYGVGIFLGLQRIEIDERLLDFIEIFYRDGDRLLVPVEDLNLIQKFSRSGTEVPMLDKLGTANWDKTKARVKKAVEAVAAELVELYARRKSQKGFSFATGEWDDEFARTFDYEETEDQLRSIREVHSDMESDSPMDRLLCGDVGYGKTEVAMRAAFKAVMDNKQVALLCPTTVLASQHLKTFQARMALFPIRVEGLSRLQSRGETEKIIKDLAAGYVDIIIGTHRLLSKDVAFHDLGLLIIDEEQRFGVAQKEKIKQLRSSVDVLTLSATPIPRTLNMSLVGLRDISLIETPPRDRLAVHTVVTPFNARLIDSAVKLELGRGGQVFYVHNRIEDIDAVSAFTKRLVPEIRLATIHGRMSATALEKRMLAFIRHEYDVLVSTTIIENGIDIPLVNTLIVDRADTYGLAQLYQLRGRVGRSSRQAFAYFLVPPYADLNPLARERLKALKEFSELGSGFRLAAKDLEIRGAGTLLGHRQHGAIEAVGFDYYTQLLDQAVRKFKGERVETYNPEIHLKADIRIPDDYIPQVNVRLNIYKKIASIEDLAEIDRIKEEILDRFGPMPEPVERLLAYGTVKCLARKLGIVSVDRIESKIILKFREEAPVDWSRISSFLKKYQARFSPEGIMTFSFLGLSPGYVLDETIRALKELSGYTKMDSEKQFC